MVLARTKASPEYTGSSQRPHEGDGQSSTSIPRASRPPHNPKEGGTSIFLATIFTAFSPPPQAMPAPSAPTLGSPRNALFSEKYPSLPSQHHLAHSQSRPLHSGGRANWPQPLPQLWRQAGLALRHRPPPAPSLPARQRGRPAPSPRACALREPPGAARTRGRMGGRTGGGRAAKVGGEPGRGRAVTPPGETFPRSRPDAALGPFQSALTALGVFQGRSLESGGCAVQDSQAGSRPQTASPSVLRAVPGTRLCFPHLTEGNMGWLIKSEFLGKRSFYPILCMSCNKIWDK